MEYLAAQPLALCVSKAGLAAGTTSTITIANDTTYSLSNGVALKKTAASNATAPTTDVNTGAAFVGVAINKGSVFTILLDSSGNIKAAQGQVTDLDVQGNFIKAPEFAGVNFDLYCPIGYLVIKVASNGSTWTLGSSNTSGVTGVTYSWKDVLTLPGRPQVA